MPLTCAMCHSVPSHVDVQTFHYLPIHCCATNGCPKWMLRHTIAPHPVFMYVQTIFIKLISLGVGIFQYCWRDKILTHIFVIVKAPNKTILKLKKGAVPTKNLQQIVCSDNVPLAKKQTPQTTSKNTHICSINSCKSREDKTNSLYRFPLDDEKMCDTWKAKCGLDESIQITSNHFVCGRHFKSSYFKTGLSCNKCSVPVMKLIVSLSL